MRHCVGSQEEYLKKIEATLETIKEKGLAVPYQTAIDAVHKAVDEARKLAITEYQLVIKTVNSAWVKILSIPQGMPGTASWHVRVALEHLSSRALTTD